MLEHVLVATTSIAIPPKRGVSKIMNRTIRSKLGVALLVSIASIPWLAAAQDQPRVTEIKPSERRFYLESPGTCESTVSDKTSGATQCGDLMVDMRFVDGVRKLLFGENDLVAFVGNENDVRIEGESRIQPISRLEVKIGNSPVVRRAAEGACVIQKQPDSNFMRTKCSASSTTPAQHMEYTFVASAGAKLSYSLNVPTDDNKSVDILINLPAQMVAGMWKRGEGSRATQTATACFKQVQYLRSFYMFLQCTSIGAAADYLRTTVNPGTDAMAPELPATFLNDVKAHFETTFATKTGKPADIEQMVRSQYSGSVWAVRTAYGSKLDGYSSSSTK